MCIRDRLLHRVPQRTEVRPAARGPRSSPGVARWGGHDRQIQRGGSSLAGDGARRRYRSAA
eukprot:13230160-Alexandrium_andersonii.AAC.1